MTHADYRGRGYATAVTGAVTAELLRFCDQVVLNVRSDNPPALQAYRKLGYREHVRFEERLVHRDAEGSRSVAAAPIGASCDDALIRRAAPRDASSTRRRPPPAAPACGPRASPRA